MSGNIQQVAIFSSTQRITHWLIAAGVIFELISAWLVQNADVDIIAWSEWHVMIGQALTLPLLLRVYLLLVRGPTHWRGFMPTRGQRHLLLETLKFYASLGRLPCPDWYAYNPVWQPIYLLIIAVLAATTATGFAMGSGPGVLNWHSTLAAIILYFTLAHIFFSVLHDIKGNGAQISAMLNGNKYFHTKQATTQITKENSVSLDSFMKK
jgi:Ni/Fe-hydrogenase 1 B-type cytochrome subunit